MIKRMHFSGNSKSSRDNDTTNLKDIALPRGFLIWGGGAPHRVGEERGRGAAMYPESVHCAVVLYLCAAASAACGAAESCGVRTQPQSVR